MNGIEDLRCIHDSDCVRLTFRWPADVEYVHIYCTENEGTETDCTKDEGMETDCTKDEEMETDCTKDEGTETVCKENERTKTNCTEKYFHRENAYLLTSDEYKRRGGYVLPKKPGIFTYFIFSDTQNKTGSKITCQTGKTTIRGTLKRKICFGKYTTHVLTLSSDYPVVGEVLSYQKQPFDGVVYSLYEPLGTKPLIRHILTKKHEGLEIFIADETKRRLYEIFIADETKRRLYDLFVRSNDGIV
jgi:hypothetical protein